jgi:SAM-dependent methyltransferase
MVSENQRKYQHRNPLQRALINHFLTSISDLIATLGVKSVLDVGCGEGFVMDHLVNKNKQVIQSIGLEIKIHSIKSGRNLFPGNIMVNGSAYQIPFHSNEFDLVICSEVLEHLDNPSVALGEIRRVSRKYCLLTVPNEPFFRLANILRGKNWVRLGNDVEHIQQWGSVGFEKFIGDGNLKLVKHLTPFPWTIILASVGQKE